MTFAEYLEFLRQRGIKPFSEEQVRRFAEITPPGVGFPLTRDGIDGIRAVKDKDGAALLVYVTNAFEGRQDLLPPGRKVRL